MFNNERFNRIMKAVDEWADENAGWDCRYEVKQEVEYILRDHKRQEWSDEQIIDSAIQTWEWPE